MTAADTSTERELRIAEFVARVRSELGKESVTLDEQRRERLSVDWAHMSPILTAKLPAGLADVVVTPRNADEIAVVVSHAYELDVPVTARGTGLGNYGQAIPLHGGVVIDVSDCRRILSVDDETVTAEAGVRMRDLEDVLAEHGRELWMFPSTKGSTLGGFLAGGSGGTGSLRHGTNADGFVRALDVAACDGEPGLRHIEGAETLPFVHAYGTTGIISRATVMTEPIHEWAGLFAAFTDYAALVAAMRALAVGLAEAPRLISGDEASIVADLPSDRRALDPQRLSLRAIVEIGTVDAARALLVEHGGEVLDVRPGGKGSDRVTSLSFNHTTFHMQKRTPDHWFHLEVGGDVLGDRPDDVRAVYAGSVIHLEKMRDALVGMLMAPYVSEDDVYRGMRELGELGVGIHSPHTWILDRRIDGIRAVLDRYDPKGLLNPGKLAAA